MPNRNWAEGRNVHDGHRGGMKNAHRPNQMNFFDDTRQPKGPLLNQGMARGQFPDKTRPPRRQEIFGLMPKMKSMNTHPGFQRQEQQGGTGEAPALEEPQMRTGGMRAGHRQPIDQMQGFSGSGAAETMKAQLQALQLADESKVFIARRINKLGFSSAEILRAYFSRYGTVENVYVSHSRVKSLKRLGGERRVTDSHWRLRAAALGFVVMSATEATAAILADGPEHTINNVTVRLQAFHRRTGSGENEDDIRDLDLADQDCAEEAAGENYPRWPSPGSDTQECIDARNLHKVPDLSGKPIVGDIAYEDFLLAGCSGVGIRDYSAGA
jgi:hypothetical protein